MAQPTVGTANILRSSQARLIPHTVFIPFVPGVTSCFSGPGNCSLSSFLLASPAVIRHEIAMSNCIALLNIDYFKRPPSPAEHSPDPSLPPPCNLRPAPCSSASGQTAQPSPPLSMHHSPTSVPGRSPLRLRCVSERFPIDVQPYVHTPGTASS